MEPPVALLSKHSFADPLNTPLSGGEAAEVITPARFRELCRARLLCRHAIKKGVVRGKGGT